MIGVLAKTVSFCKMDVQHVKICGSKNSLVVADRTMATQLPQLGVPKLEIMKRMATRKEKIIPHHSLGSLLDIATFSS